MVALREILMTLVVVFFGKVEEKGVGANETVGGGGGRGGGLHKGIRDAVDAASFSISGEGTCLTGDCELGFSANDDSDISDTICIEESDIRPLG